MVAVTDAGYTKPRTHTEAVPGTGVKKLTPHTTKKKLPWLGGKPSGFMSPMPAQRPGSDIQSPSPSTRPSSRKPSAVVAPRSVPIKSARKKSLVVPTRPRFPSLAGSSPSPVARHRLSQARRVSIAPKDPSPLRAQAAHRPFALHEPQKRLSIVQHHNEELEEANFGKVRPRTDSLAPVPDHLEISDTSDSTFGREVASSSSLAVISRVQMAPLQPTPSRTAIEPIYDRKLSTAIEGLEDMVQEAVDIADEIADRHGVEEIYEIIEDARAAIQDASKHPMANLMATTSPLAISGSSGEVQDVEPEFIRCTMTLREVRIPLIGLTRHKLDSRNLGFRLLLVTTRNMVVQIWTRRVIYFFHHSLYNQSQGTMWILCFDPLLETTLVVVHASG
jgi:hypothetical protein